MQKRTVTVNSNVDESQGSLYVPEETSQSESYDYPTKRTRTQKIIKDTTKKSSHPENINEDSRSGDTKSFSPPLSPSSTAHNNNDKTNNSLTVLSDRKKKSLHHLTVEFVRLIKMQPTNSIDVQTASSYLNVEKRRIYDITNALIGANMLEKKGKSLYQWIGNDNDSLNDNVKELYYKEGELTKESQQLDIIYNQLKNQIDDIKKNTVKMNYAYITKDQLMSTLSNREQTVFALMATPGTDVQTSCDINPDGTKSYELYLCSTQGPLETYLVHYIDPESNKQTDLSTNRYIPKDMLQDSLQDTTTNTSMHPKSTLTSQTMTSEKPSISPFFPLTDTLHSTLHNTSVLQNPISSVTSSLTAKESILKKESLPPVSPFLQSLPNSQVINDITTNGLTYSSGITPTGPANVYQTLSQTSFYTPTLSQGHSQNILDSYYVNSYLSSGTTPLCLSNTPNVLYPFTNKIENSTLYHSQPYLNTLTPSYIGNSSLVESFLEDSEAVSTNPSNGFNHDSLNPNHTSAMNTTTKEISNTIEETNDTLNNTSIPEDQILHSDETINGIISLPKNYSDPNSLLPLSHLSEDVDLIDRFLY